MLYKTLLKLKERTGLTDALKTKIDVFYAIGRLTEEEYCDLMGIPFTKEDDTILDDIANEEVPTEEAE